jgi:site-specific DNA-methyltransferase (adenine-specific)
LLNAYYKRKDIRLYLGNAIEVLDQIPDESVDLIFADPPYNLSNDGFTCHAGRRVSVNKGKWDRSRGFEKDFEFHYSWIEKCRRILKPNGTIWISGTYHSIYMYGFALQKQGWHIINEICWYKPNASPNLSCRMFTASHETLIWAKKGKIAKHTFNYQLSKTGSWEDDFLKKPGKQMRSVWAINTPKNWEKRYGKHPTQKPELLLKRIILLSSNPGNVILDPFCGSGTTGVVAVRYGRRFVGIDFEEKYLKKIAIPRIKDEIKVDSIFLRENEKIFYLDSENFEEVFK